MNTTDMMRVMTFNLRVETLNDGINRFSSRKPRILEMIQRESPDLIGFQEANDDMRAVLRDDLSQYVVLGCGRKGAYDGEGIPVAYRKDRFELIEFQTKWLSPTPDVPDSRFGVDQSKYPRIYVLCKLRRLTDNRVMVLINTHTDHEGEQARMLESLQLLEVIRKTSADAIFMTGDFNAKPESKEIQALTADAELGLMDLSKSLSGSFHNFGRRVPPWKIDYIFSTVPCLECHLVEDLPVNGMYLSDHNAIVASIPIG